MLPCEGNISSESWRDFEIMRKPIQNSRYFILCSFQMPANKSGNITTQAFEKRSHKLSITIAQ